jgi:hypothetical protein
LRDCTPSNSTRAHSSPQKETAARIDADTAIVKQIAGHGALDETLGHFHAIERVGATTMVTWTDTTQKRTFSAERLWKGRQRAAISSRDAAEIHC